MGCPHSRCRGALAPWGYGRRHGLPADRRGAGPLAVHRPPLAAPCPRPWSSHPALAARRTRTHPTRRRRVQPAGEHRQLATRRPHRSRRRGLVGTPAAGHHRAREDPHRAPHPRTTSGPARLTPSGARFTARARGRARPAPRHHEHHRVGVHTNYRLVVLTESDWIMVILNAGQHPDRLSCTNSVRRHRSALNSSARRTPASQADLRTRWSCLPWSGWTRGLQSDVLDQLVRCVGPILSRSP
jgi:hypothetical protein